MTFGIRIRPAAEGDVEQLFRWYEEQSNGLGRRLVVELDEVYARVLENPFMYAEIYRGIRRAFARHFPVGVFYKVLDSQIHVIAINHLAGDPSKWKRRR